MNFHTLERRRRALRIKQLTEKKHVVSFSSFSKARIPKGSRADGEASEMIAFARRLSRTDDYAGSRLRFARREAGQSRRGGGPSL